MRGEPNIAAVAALLADPGRATMLTALAGGRALPAGELAALAGLSASGASAHLSRLVEGGLLAVEQQGRHRYYRLAGGEVAAALEGLAALTGPTRLAGRSQPPEAEALRRARSCYDHLAGELGVGITEALEAAGYLASGEGRALQVTAAGGAWFTATLSIEVPALRPGRHGVAHRCLDWTERRHHLAGPLGAALFRRLGELGWISRVAGSRAVRVTRLGRDGLRDGLGVVLPA
ncbi:MAG: helix-turn-helix transcriptional regulator [Acetobacteraceae bacterium]|nr:helix-turn-helix transcriptional regulator [Acetobacteraceae bacterium]